MIFSDPARRVCGPSLPPQSWPETQQSWKAWRRSVHRYFGSICWWWWVMVMSEAWSSTNNNLLHHLTCPAHQQGRTLAGLKRWLTEYWLWQYKRQESAYEWKCSFESAIKVFTVFASSHFLPIITIKNDPISKLANTPIIDQLPMLVLPVKTWVTLTHHFNFWVDIPYSYKQIFHGFNGNQYQGLAYHHSDHIQLSSYDYTKLKLYTIYSQSMINQLVNIMCISIKFWMFTTISNYLLH